MPKGQCAKQTVKATIIATDGQWFVGTNYCNNPQPVCPRDLAGMKTGEGYHLCKDICQQSGHAEINAIQEAGRRAKGSNLYLEGHYYACDDCKQAADDAGIINIVIGPPDA